MAWDISGVARSPVWLDGSEHRGKWKGKTSERQPRDRPRRAFPAWVDYSKCYRHSGELRGGDWGPWESRWDVTLGRPLRRLLQWFRQEIIMTWTKTVGMGIVRTVNSELKKIFLKIEQAGSFRAWTWKHDRKRSTYNWFWEFGCEWLGKGQWHLLEWERREGEFFYLFLGWEQ